MSDRPLLSKLIDPSDFRDFYWLKEELMAFCRSEKLASTGGKKELEERIINYLTTGTATKPLKAKRAVSKFDWNKEELTLQTIITDNYKNSENVRSFFLKEVGSRFKFNVRFMNWMNSNQGKTLKDAIAAWHELKQESKSGHRKDIAPQFEYNTYMRDFLEDNPGTSRAVAIKCWKHKKSLRGHNRYEKTDLLLNK